MLLRPSSGSEEATSKENRKSSAMRYAKSNTSKSTPRFHPCGLNKYITITKSLSRRVLYLLLVKFNAKRAFVHAGLYPLTWLVSRCPRVSSAFNTWKPTSFTSHSPYPVDESRTGLIAPLLLSPVKTFFHQVVTKLVMHFLTVNGSNVTNQSHKL